MIKNHILRSPLNLHKFRTPEQHSFLPQYTFPPYIMGVIRPKNYGICNNHKHVERTDCYEINSMLQGGSCPIQIGCYRKVAVLFWKGSLGKLLCVLQKTGGSWVFQLRHFIIIHSITKTSESCIHSSPITTNIWISFIKAGFAETFHLSEHPLYQEIMEQFVWSGYSLSGLEFTTMIG